MKYKEILDTLLSRGNLVRAYKQASVAATAPASLQGHIGDGFCSGASLDWLRCILQGGSPTYSPDVVMAGFAQIMQAPTKRNDFRSGFLKQLDQAQAIDKQNVEKAIAKMQMNGEQIIRQRMPGMTQAQLDAFVDEISQKMNLKAQAMYDDHENRFQAAKSADSIYQRFWPHFNKLMDEKLGQRLGAQRYAGLTVAGASQPRMYGPPNGAVALINQVLDDPAFTAGNGVLLGVYAPISGGAGHAVAIRRMNNGNYLYFDPNFGSILYSYENMRWAFVWLFLKGYPQLEDGTKDNKDYQINGRIRGEYVVYRGAVAAPPAVRNLGSASATRALNALAS
jgi:hypothetical protein